MDELLLYYGQAHTKQKHKGIISDIITVILQQNLHLHLQFLNCQMPVLRVE